MPKSTPFTREQMDILEKNIYTHHVTPNMISFTVAFKEFFAEQVKVPGMTTKKIMSAAGYDPNFFSSSSLDALRIRILKEKNRLKDLKVHEVFPVQKEPHSLLPKIWQSRIQIQALGNFRNVSYILSIR